MISKFLKQTLFIVVLVTTLVVEIVFASETPAALDNAVTLYADYGNGFEFLAKLYFEKDVSKKTVTIEKTISKLRVVRGKCYDLNLDELTLEGVCPIEYEHKLSKTDNDLIEIIDSMDFELSGKGRLVISARAPKKVMGEQYSIKFPKHNIGAFTTTSFFYNYTLGSNYGIISDDEELKLPNKEKFFVREMCYPDSGHPNAPIDFYVADDGETLYVFFEAFVDNTLDNGKDFAGVHIKCGDKVKSYKVYTTEENEFGHWWFDYTNSSDEYDWQHMNYLVKIPISDVQNDSGKLDIAFEYYGTVSAQEELEEVCIGDVFYISKERKESDLNYAETYGHEPYYDETVRVLPAPGKTSNAESGDTQEGEWWITNTGTEEKPTYTLTLNGATINKTHKKYNDSNYFWTYGSLTIELAEGTTNIIGVDSTSCQSYSMDITGSLDIVIQGEGTLSVYGRETAIYAYTWTTLTVCDGATVNAIVNGSSSSTRSAAILFENYYKNKLVIDNATLTVTNNNTSNQVVGIMCGESVTLENNATLEITTSGGESNYALYLKNLDSIIYDSDEAILLEGNNANDAEEVDELTNTITYAKSSSEAFYSMPYVLITQGKTTPSEVVEFEVVNIPTGGECTETIGNNVEVSYDNDKYMVIPDQYAESLEDSENYKWFEGTYESGAYYTGSALLMPIGNMNLYKAGIEIANGTLRKVEWVYDGNDKPTGELKIYFDVLVKKDATVIKSLNVKCKTLPKSGDTYFEPEVSNGTNFEVFDAHWEDGSGDIPNVFENDKEYYLVLTVIPKRGYIFGDTVSATVNSSTKQEVETELVLGRTELKLKVPKKAKTSGGGGSSSTSDYKITTKIENGSITPDISSVKKNTTQEFKFKADKGYEIIDVLIDGKSVGAVDKYTLENVNEKHTIEVKTRKIETKPADRFKDVKPDDWFYDSVNYVVENGLFEGTTETTFSPNQNLTRGMFVTVLYRLAGATDTTKSTFDDVDSDKYYSSAIAWANKNGYVVGIGNNKFNPEAPITREDLATIIYRYVKAQGKGFKGAWMFLLEFVDRDEISEYAYEPICWLTMNGIMEGKEGNKFDPKGFASRTETAKIIQKVSEYFK